MKTVKMLSFHNDPAIKQKYLDRVRAHALADEIVKGQYWENGKGCAVGCTIHSSAHGAYQTELGLPEWLARLEDTIFEGLPTCEAKKFPEQFLSTIPIGVDLEQVRWKFCAFLMHENIERVLALPDLNDDLRKQIVDAIRQVLTYFENATEDKSAAKSAAESAARSAESAAESAARSAAWSAAESAWSAAKSAWSAAKSAARSAESAAWSAAESARSAAWSAAWSAAESAALAAYLRYRDELLQLFEKP